MANILDFGGVRALTSNAQPGAGYVAEFYTSGTTDPVTVYTDSTLGTAHGTSVTADSAGRFAAVWSSGGAVKCIIKDADGATVETIDPVLSVAGGGDSAEDIAFEPTVDLPFTNVQDAIEGAVASAASGYAAFGIGITGNATPLADINAVDIGAGLYRFDGTTTGTYPTGVAAADTGLIEHWRQAGATAMQVLYHATTDRVFHRRMASTTWGTWREVITTNQGAAEGDIIYRGASAWTRLAKGTAGQGLIMNGGATAPEWAGPGYTWSAVITNGAPAYDVTSIPSWASDIVCTFFGVSLATKSDSSFIQIGPGGVAETSGYVATHVSVGDGLASAGANYTNGFFIGSSADTITGSFRLLRRSGANEWVASGQVRRSVGAAAATNILSGAISFGGALDIVRLVRSGAGNYDGGVFAVGYK